MKPYSQNKVLGTSKDSLVSDIYLMDCIEGMKQYPDKYFDLAVVDPPYGINVTEQTIGGSSLKKYKKLGNWDNEPPKIDYWNELFRISKNQIVWGANYFNQNLEQGNKWLVWDKMLDIDSSHFEIAWTSFKGAERFIRSSRSKIQGFQNPSRFHPTEKPVYLYDWIFKNFATEGMKVLDTHLGSGSSRIAAYKGGFNFVGFEIDSEYIEKSTIRFNNHINQLTLF
jgi:site-specific DNA-methyltransferase (adenine-specific)